MTKAIPHFLKSCSSVFIMLLERDLVKFRVKVKHVIKRNSK
jgi:hypothetical protein